MRWACSQSDNDGKVVEVNKLEKWFGMGLSNPHLVSFDMH